MNIIVAPLNWGIGHATRVIPVIHLLLQKGATVLLASDGEALAVLRKAFPKLAYTELPSYNIRYQYQSLAQNSLGLVRNMLKGMKQEQKKIQQLVKTFQADIIISDNRYGCYSSQTHNIFLTHQLQLLPGSLAGKGATFINQHLLRPFETIWVPDFPSPPTLAGKISRSKKTNIQYIGPLSRFTPLDTYVQDIDILAILSGPEPQRTNLEQQLIQSFALTNKKTVIVRGKPLETKTIHSPYIQLINYANSTQLKELIGSSQVIISRSGYSSIMDYLALGILGDNKHQLILIPTPGQPEQIFLANRLMEDGLCYSANQQDFHLAKALKATTYQHATPIPPRPHLLQKTIDKLF